MSTTRAAGRASIVCIPREGSSDGLPGGASSGEQGNHPPLAGGIQPASHRQRHGAVARDGAALHRGGRGGRAAARRSRARLRGLLQHAAALHRPPRLGSPAASDRAHGGRAAGRGRGAGLRPARPHRGPRERAAPHGLGADRGLALLAALLRLADHQPDAARGGRGPGGGLGVLRGRAPLPRDRQLPGRRGRGRRAAPALHAGLPRVRPPAWLHQRPRARAPAPRQAPGRAQRPLRARALLQGRPVPRPRRTARRRPALVPRGSGAAHPRDDPQTPARGLPGRGAPAARPLGR